MLFIIDGEHHTKEQALRHLVEDWATSQNIHPARAWTMFSNDDDLQEQIHNELALLQTE